MMQYLPWAQVCHGLHAAVRGRSHLPWVGEHDGNDSDAEDVSPCAATATARDREQERDDEEADEDEEASSSPSGGIFRRIASLSLVGGGGSAPEAVRSPFSLRATSGPLLDGLGFLGCGLEGGSKRRASLEDHSCRQEEPEEGGEPSRCMRRSKSEPLRKRAAADACGEEQDSRQIVLGRYAYSPGDVIGRGGFSTVRRGVDLATGRPVAIKTYSDMERRLDSSICSEDESDLHKQFEDEVRSLLALHEAPLAFPGQSGHGSFVLRAGDDPELGRRAFERLPPSKDLFVEILDFSREGDEAPRSAAALDREGAHPPARRGRGLPSAAVAAPGPAADGRCYLVLELATETLEQFLASLRGPLCKADVRRIFRQVCEVVAALHSLGFVHLDLKPANLMRFPSGRFKLIDMDGVLRSGTRVPLTDVISTAKYCAPEFARASLEDDVADDVQLDVSRALDVFSLGLVGAELATRRHPLEDTWRRFMGGANDDERGFYQFLSEPGLALQPLPPEVRAASPGLEDLLQSMLRTGANGRSSMLQVMAHPFFAEHPTRLTSAPPSVAPTPRGAALAPPSVVPLPPAVPRAHTAHVLAPARPRAQAAPAAAHATPRVAAQALARRAPVRRWSVGSETAVPWSKGGQQVQWSPYLPSVSAYGGA